MRRRKNGERKIFRVRTLIPSFPKSRTVSISQMIFLAILPEPRALFPARILCAMTTLMRWPSSFSEFVDAIGSLISIRDLGDGSFGQSRFRFFRCGRRRRWKNEKCGGNVMDPFSFSPTSSPARPPSRGSEGPFPPNGISRRDSPFEERGNGKRPRRKGLLISKYVYAPSR